jgi:hypothetical protein
MRILRLIILGILLAFISCTRISDCSNISSNDIEDIDTCLIGKTIEECINQLGVKPSQFIPHVLFYRDIFGIYIRTGNVKITLLIEGSYSMTNEEAEGEFLSMYKHILKKKVKGLCWVKEKLGKGKVVGNTHYPKCMSL